jgi:hypothetical protein
MIKTAFFARENFQSMTDFNISQRAGVVVVPYLRNLRNLRNLRFRLFFSFPRSAWECRVGTLSVPCSTHDAERLSGIPTQSVGTRKG